jgi:hypothetical protein
VPGLLNSAFWTSRVPTDWAGLAASYAVATGTAVGAAAGLGRVVERMQARVGGGTAGAAGGAPLPFGVRLLSRALPWLAVATAGSANVVAMRYKEAL